MIDQAISAKAKTLIRGRMTKPGENPAGEYEYRASCERLPILLRSAGMKNAVFYLHERDNAVYEDLQEQLQDAGFYSSERKLDLVELMSSDPPLASYRHISTVAMRVALWHKRLAQALLKRRTP